MVIYDLVCANFHTFEGWFKDNKDFKAQQAAGLIACPACDSTEVKLKPSKVAIAGKKSNQSSQTVENISAQAQESAPQSDNAMHFNSSEEQISALRDFIENNFEDVGNKFSEEVRKMHYGETDHRGIRGQATQEEIKDLNEEGIDTYAVPLESSNKNNLN